MEYTCPLAEEMEDPGRNIPLGIFLGLTLVSVPVDPLRPRGRALRPGDQLGAFSPVAHMEAAIAILGDTGKWWMALISIGGDALDPERADRRGSRGSSTAWG